MKIIFRDIIDDLRRFLNSDEILLLTGARQAGKTSILRFLQDELNEKKAKTFFLNFEDPDYLRLINQSPKNLFKIFPINLKERTFVFIDEVQYLKNPTNFLKYFYDEYQGKIKIIASGSSAFYLDKKFKDSLVGRKLIFPVRTLSFREFLRFKGEEELIESLPKKFSLQNYHLVKKISLSEIEKIENLYFEFLLYGGYPRVVLAPLSDKTLLLQDIAYSYIKKDVYEAEIRQDEFFYRLLKILAGQIGNLVNVNELSSTLGISRKAITNYLYVMQKSFHILLLKPFYKNFRKELTKMPKVYFYDTGLRNFLINNFEPLLNRQDRGEILENAVMRQLAERAGILTEEKIKFWRYRTGAEVDFIFEEKIAFEVKFDAHSFKKSKYSLFMEKYPGINFNLVSFSDEPKIELPIWKPWLL
jgi:predicted AAA+ superfamily ATPase